MSTDLVGTFLRLMKQFINDDSTHVILEIHNVLGQRVATLINKSLKAGKHSLMWDAEDFATGIYFSKLKTGDKVYSRRIVLLK
ncbi:MAG: T9SS type A sorting domain-containing protein [candidate division Zixibacteria bacterium]|nr:T9SS type A sorting domain-containing protein [candidate division Zixibacteria bacterium]